MPLSPHETRLPEAEEVVKATGPIFQFQTRPSIGCRPSHVSHGQQHASIVEATKVVPEADI